MTAEQSASASGSSNARSEAETLDVPANSGWSKGMEIVLEQQQVKDPALLVANQADIPVLVETRQRSTSLAGLSALRFREFGQLWQGLSRRLGQRTVDTRPKKSILLNPESLKAKRASRLKTRRPLRVHFRLQKKFKHQSFHLLERDSKLLRRWELFMVVAMAYECWAFPFRLAFADRESQAMVTIMDFTADAVFLVDMILQLLTVIPANSCPGQDEAATTAGDVARLYFRFVFPFQILPMFPYYVMLAISDCDLCWGVWAATVPRLVPRAQRLMGYFRSMERNLKVSVQALQGLKFSLVLFLSAHWVGCIFYWLARLRGLDDKTWVADFQTLLPQFTREDAVGKQYLVTIYKGFSALSNLGYDIGLPNNAVELLWSMIVMAFQVYISALILGTLLNYLVAKDPVEEAHRRRMDLVTEYADAKQLPSDLRERIDRYLHFQHQKNVQNSAAAHMSLPKSLEIKVADLKFRSVIDKCTVRGGVFFGVDKTFLSALLVKLKVVHVMPGEEFVSKDDIPRELYFVLEGQVRVMDDENRVKRVIRNDVPDMAPICGEAPFFLGVNHHDSLRARPTGDVQLLVLKRADGDDLFAMYPEDFEIISENILSTFGVDSDGKELEGANLDDINSDKQKQLLRASIVSSIRRRSEERFAALIFAVNNGDLESVALLARQGVDIDQVDYDGRTILHMACADGNYKLVEMLLDLGADKNCHDRWGSTPLAEAIANRQTLIAGLLSQWKAKLDTDQAASHLCESAAGGDLEAVRRLVENEVDPNVGDYDGRRAMHVAAAEGHLKVVEFLLANKGDPNVKDRWGGTPLQDAVHNGHTALAGVIRARGGQLPPRIGVERVCKGAAEGDLTQLRLLHSCGESVEVCDYDSRYPLHLAAAEARILAVSYLLGMSADPSCTDRWGGTPMDDALQGGTLYHLYCAKLLHCWGGTLGTLAGTEEGARLMAELDKVNISDVRALIKRLISAGYDNRTPKHLSEQDWKVSFGATVQHMPVVREIGARAEGLKTLLKSNLEASSSVIAGLKDVVRLLAVKLDSVSTSAAKMRRNRRNSVMGAADGFLQRSPSFESMATDDASGVAIKHNFAQMVDALDEEDEEEFEGGEYVEEMDSDEELALYRELDTLVEAQERCEAAGTSAEQIAASTFQRAALRLIEYGAMFDTLCLVVRQASGPRSSPHDGEPSMNMDSLTRLAELLGVGHDVDLEEIYEDAQTYHDEFGDHHNHHQKQKQPHGDSHARQQPPPAHSPVGHNHLHAQTQSFPRTASDHKKSFRARHHADGQSAEEYALAHATAYPVSAFLAGSDAFRRMLSGLQIDSDLCFLLDTRLFDALSEYSMRALLPTRHATYQAGTVIYDSSASAPHFFCIAKGECQVVSADDTELRHLYRGDVFGALAELSARPPPTVHVKAVGDCQVREISVESLVDVIGGDSTRLAAVMACMGEAAAAEEQAMALAQSKDGGMKRSISFSTRGARSSRVGPTDGDDDDAGGGEMSGRSLSSGGSDRDAQTTALELPMMIGEMEKRTLKELVQQLNNIWLSFSMGSLSFHRSLFRTVHKNLREVSSECFKKMFLSVALPENVQAMHFWKCWVDFLADEVFGEDAAVPPPEAIHAVHDDHEHDAEKQHQPAPPQQEEEEEEAGLLERLHARFAPSRSLKTRFFEDDVLETYEVAWEKVCGDVSQPLSVERVPQLLMHVFNDFGYPITSRNVNEFLVEFGRNIRDNKALLWVDVRKVLNDYRMGVKIVHHGPFLGSAINPNWPPLARWAVVARLCAVYYLVMVPVRIAFAPWPTTTHRTALLTDLIVDTLVFIDLVIRCNTAYKSHTGAWQTRWSKVVRKTQFAVLIGGLPWDWFGYACGAGVEGVNLLRMPRVLYVQGCSTHVFRRSTQNLIRNKLEDMFRLIALILHWSACLWYYLGREYEHWAPHDSVSWLKVDAALAHVTYDRETLFGLNSGATVWEQYLISLYWVSATLTVNGLVGDVIPQNLVEIFFTIVLMVINLTVFRWVIGEISTIIMSADNEFVKQRENLEMVESFISGHSLPEDVESEIRTHYQSMHAGLTVDQGEVYAMLSHNLQMEVAQVVAREYLEGAELFKGCSSQLLDAVAVLLREVSFSPEQWLFHEAETANEMYVLVSGGVEEVEERNNEIKVEKHVRTPGAVGELPFFFGIRHYQSARASRISGATCLKLEKAQFTSLMKLFSNDEEIVAKNAIRVMEMVNSTRGASSRGGGSRASSAKNSKRSLASSQNSRPSNDSKTGEDQKAEEARNEDKLFGDDGANVSDDDKQTISSQQSRASNLQSDVVGVGGGGKSKNKIAALKARRKNDVVTSLLIASSTGDLTGVQKALENDISPNDVDPTKRSALHVAASEGHVKVVRLLLESQADPHMKDKFGNTPLNDAVRHHRDAVAKLLRDLVPGITVCSKGKQMAVDLCQSAFEGNLLQIKRLVANGVSASEADYDDRTALHLAACEGHLEVCKYLLEKKANIDAEDRFGGTPIQDAVRHKRTEVQALLRRHGARLEQGTADYSVKLCEAAAAGDLETIKTLAKNGVDLEAGDYDGRTALHLAAANEKVGVLEYLLSVEPPIEINSCDRFGMTPLDDATRHKRGTAISMLTARGALQKGDAKLQEVIERQVEAAKARQQQAIAPLIQNALTFSQEQRALEWMREKLEPTMAQTTATLLEGVNMLRDILTPFTSTALHGGLRLTFDLSAASPMASSPVAAARPLPGASTELSRIRSESEEDGGSGGGGESAVTEGGGEDGTGELSLPGMAKAMKAVHLLRQTAVKRRALLCKDGEVDPTALAEEAMEQVDGVRRSIFECMSVLTSNSAQLQGTPIDCLVWKMASSRYREEAMELRKVLRMTGRLCRITRKIMKEIIRHERRKSKAKKKAPGAGYRNISAGRSGTRRNLFAEGH